MKENFKLVLCDFNEGLCEMLREAFVEYPEVEIRYGRFEDVDYDCVVSPANSFGLMDGGIDEAIAMKFGEEAVLRVQDVILKKYGGEQPIGSSEIIKADEFGKFIAHTPTMIIPELIRETDNVYLAMKAMLFAVENHNKESLEQINTVVCSGLGTGAGRVPYTMAAQGMKRGYESFKFRPKRLDWSFAISRYKHIKGR